MDDTKVVNLHGNRQQAETDETPEFNWTTAIDGELRRLLFADALKEGAEQIAEFGDHGNPVALSNVATYLDNVLEVPEYVPGGFLNPHGYVPEDSKDFEVVRWNGPEEQAALGILPLLHEVRVACWEFALHRRVRFRVRWFARPKQARGKPLLARSRKVTPQDRACWPEGDLAPMFDLEISLAWWLVSGRMERLRGLHYALSCCDLVENDRGKLTARIGYPDVETFVSTLARFGPGNREEAAALQAMVEHPQTEEAAKRYDFGDDGQGALFGPYQVPPPELGKNL